MHLCERAYVDFSLKAINQNCQNYIYLGTGFNKSASMMAIHLSFLLSRKQKATKDELLDSFSSFCNSIYSYKQITRAWMFPVAGMLAHTKRKWNAIKLKAVLIQNQNILWNDSEKEIDETKKKRN